MQSTLAIVASLAVLAVLVRFAVPIAHDAGILNAGWEAVGWLTLGLIVAVGSALIEGTATSQDLGAADDAPVAAKQGPSLERLKPGLSAGQQPKAEIPLSVPRETTVDTGAGATVTVAAPTTKTAATPSPENSPRSVDRMSRHELLAELHTETTRKFVSAPGFGFERRIRIDQFETPEKQRLYLPRQPILAGTSVDSVRKEIPLPDRTSFQSSPTVDKKVAQLQQLLSQLKGTPTTATASEDAEPKEVRVVDAEPEWDEWELSDWELVSILKNDPPAVYASSAMRMMHRPLHAATRALDALEQDALAELRTGETLVVADGVNAIRMLGAVRATAKCVRCHAGKQEGDLLGAFSYELHRMQPIAVAARIGD